MFAENFINNSNSKLLPGKISKATGPFYIIEFLNTSTIYLPADLIKDKVLSKSRTVS